MIHKSGKLGDPKHPEQIVCAADGREWTYLERPDAKKSGSKPVRPGLKA